MRPIRLEIEGFTAFREPAVIDFDDAPYFALVGPTGAGKSSLIDAMTFALYGSIPRLDMKSVAPIVSQGEVQARIRFDFAIADTTYTAVRVVRKTGTDRATTKEARLERDGETLAGDADGVTAAVERVLGLGYEHFTKCVVLPQGAFARFMHDKPADRQDLLVELLDLGVYEQMAQAANARAGAATLEAEMNERRLTEELAFATPEARDETEGRVRALEALFARIETEEAQLEELRERVREARAAEQTAGARIEALARLAVPADVARLSEALESSTVAWKAAEDVLGDAEDAVRSAEKVLGELPERAPLDQARAAHEQRDACALDLERVTQQIAAAADAERASQAAQAEHAERLAAAEAHHDAVRLEHRAHELALMVRAGESCPVCGQTVDEPPAVGAPAALDEAAAAARAAREEHAAAVRAATRAQVAHAEAGARGQQLREQMARLDDLVRAHPDRSALDRLLAEVHDAQTALEAARRNEGAARAASAAALKAVEATRARIDAAWKQLEGARDPLADLGPPPLGRENLLEDWTTLAEWALGRARELEASIEASAHERALAERHGLQIAEAQRTACRELGIEDPSVPRDAVLKAIERARATLERIELALESAAELRAEHARLTERAAVSRTLANHLKANAFEAWILDEALRMLQEGATEILGELSGGQYALTLDKNRNIAVIDHRNAGEVRSAKTLSGGETFLASLALALALADRIAQLSANSAVRLESIFLDEGFGSLDPETLDVVEAAIANLAAGGRVVGIVTHVRDLAERVPVRFEVRRGPATSTVEKVFA